jgi:hypothetical protein
MSKQQKDRHLDVPSEADRDKHINYLAEERSESDPAVELNGSLDKEDKNAANRNEKNRNRKISNGQ